jgi:hypothetical protein
MTIMNMSRTRKLVQQLRPRVLISPLTRPPPLPVSRSVAHETQLDNYQIRINAVRSFSDLSRRIIVLTSLIGVSRLAVYSADVRSAEAEGKARQRQVESEETGKLKYLSPELVLAVSKLMLPCGAGNVRCSDQRSVGG